MTVTTSFTIKQLSNPSITIDGYVERNDTVGEDCEWYFYNYGGFANQQLIVKHDKMGVTPLSYSEREAINQFEHLYRSEVGMISEFILNVDYEDIINENTHFEKNDICIDVTDVDTDCIYDAHDFLCGVCDKCGECGFETYGDD